MKPILHIVKNTNDMQAIDIIKRQAMDNAYGVTVVFIHNIGSIPSISNARICVLREAITNKTTSHVNTSDAELIDYTDILNMVFSVESVTVW